jgi:peptide deformylase
MKLSLAYYGDPILRKKGSPVVEINDEIRQLVADMIETMEANNGIGLAAPQVHRSLALFITSVPLEGPDDTSIPGTLRVFINPKIISYSKEQWECSEGCLSIPLLYGSVNRPLKVTVQATDLDGREFIQEFEGLEAHAVMHENDHINGVLFIDRIRGKERKELEPQLREVKKKYARG